MNGFTPNHTLHNNMISACKKELGIYAVIDKDLTRLAYKKGKVQLRPDVFLGNIVVECQTMSPNSLTKLEKYGDRFGYTIFCISIPTNVKEIWTYDISNNLISSKNKLPSNHKHIQTRLPISNLYDDCYIDKK